MAVDCKIIINFATQMKRKIVFVIYQAILVFNRSFVPAIPISIPLKTRNLRIYHLFHGINLWMVVLVGIMLHSK